MMKRCLALAAVCTSLMPLTLHAQARATATRAGIVQAGAGYTSADPDYSQKRIAGLTGYATFDFLYGGHVGIEADAHVLLLSTPQDISESSYEVGPRFVYRKGRYEPYAKLMFGLANQTFRRETYNPQVSTNYLDYAFGAGLDIRLPHHLNVRAFDFEFQTWPTYSPNNLSPTMITVGVAYRLR